MPKLSRQKVVICDIDGVLADYMESLRQYISVLTGKRLRTIDRNCYGPSQAMKIPRGRMDRYQAMHYINGALARAPLYDPWIVDMIKALAKTDVQVILLTNRPAHRYPRLEPDTMEWLRFYNIPFHKLVFTPDKGEYIDDTRDKHEILYAIEDMPENCKKFADRGVLTFMPDRPYNRKAEEHPMIRRVKRASDIAFHMSEHSIQY